ncbi:MAG: glycosyltransferase [Clostridia bacterium]|nr:glycosyltransferase [Clostridia bacterium]
MPTSGRLRSRCNRCDVVIAPSRYAAGELRRLGVRRPVTVISNGIDLDRFAVERPAGPAKAGEGGGSGAAEGSVTVLFAGRLSPEKGVRSAAEALDLALREEPRLLARFAGDGPLADALRQRLAPHLAAGRVSLLGHRPWEAMAAEYARADLLLLPSPAETQGLAALEAMAAGLPVVAARAGALPELVRDGESGLTVEPGDVPALAQAVLRLARDAELRRRLGSGARDVAEEHEAGRVLARLLALYTGLLGTAPRRREAGQRGAA